MPRDDYNPNAGEPDREASVAQSSHRSLPTAHRSRVGT